MLYNPLSPSTTKTEKVVNVLAAFGIAVIWCSILSGFYKWLFESGAQGFPFLKYKHDLLIKIFGACILAPIIEELLFRYIPIRLACHSERKDVVYTVILLSSIIFGLVHSGGLYSVPMQGVVGLILSYIYLKNNFSYLSCVVLHCLWNSMLVFGMYENLKF